MVGDPFSFYTLAVVAIASALGVVLFRNAVYCMLSLIVNLLSLAAFFLTLNAIFVATIQVLIYAGAVMVLFLFVVTMLSPNVSSAEARGSGRNRFQWVAGLATGVVLAIGLIVAIANGSLASDITGNGLAHQVATAGNTEAFGLALFHGFSFPFEVTSLLLVVSVLGAVILGRRIAGREHE